MSSVPRVSIVVPTRNRPQLLANCLQGIEQTAHNADVEVIIVDDGSVPPLDAGRLSTSLAPIVVRLEGAGPAAARNAGAGVARGEIVLFTDDDAVPSRLWVAAAIAYLDDHPQAVGVRGPIRSVAWDRLYEHSIMTKERPAASGHHWTCNIAYRRDALERLGGFREDVFVHAHAEDRDLGIRALQVGEIGFAPNMEVNHTPRRLTIRDVARSGGWARDDLVLYTLHPHLTEDFTLPVRLALVSNAAKRSVRRARTDDRAKSPTRVLRAFVLMAVDVTSTAWSLLRAPSMRVLRSRHALDRS